MFINLVYNEEKVFFFFTYPLNLHIYQIKREAVITSVDNTLILMQHVQIIQKKGNMKNHFIINIYEKLNLCEY